MRARRAPASKRINTKIKKNTTRRKLRRVEMVEELSEDVILLPSHLRNCAESTGGLRNRSEGRARLKDKLAPPSIQEGVTDSVQSIAELKSTRM